MASKTVQVNKDVSDFLAGLNHPLIEGIELLREIILHAEPSLSENIKWNGPNYHVEEQDRITMKIQPPKNIQLIFHRGAKATIQPAANLIKDDSGLLLWKATDRAVATFKSTQDIAAAKKDLTKLVKDWIRATV